MSIANGTMGVIEKDEFGNVFIAYENGYRDAPPFRTVFEAGYAITVHASQGSEYDHVLYVVDSSEHFDLERGFMCTAVSRSKKSCVLIGTKTRIDAVLTSPDALLEEETKIPFGAKRTSGPSRFHSAIERIRTKHVSPEPLDDSRPDGIKRSKYFASE